MKCPAAFPLIPSEIVAIWPTQQHFMPPPRPNRLVFEHSQPPPQSTALDELVAEIKTYQNWEKIRNDFLLKLKYSAAFYANFKY
jgi:hypothetical protein